MIAATANESNGKSSQVTFLKVGQNLYRNESSETYYGLTKRAGKQFRTALRMSDGTPIKDRTLAERALRKWLADLENIVPEAVSADEHLVLLKEEEGRVALIAGGLVCCNSTGFTMVHFFKDLIDTLGPDKWLGVLIVGFDVTLNGFD